MKLWFQKHTVIGRMPWLDQAYHDHLHAVLPPDTQVHLRSLPAATYDTALPAGYVRYGQLEVLFSWYFAASAITAERLGYDAYIVGTSQDPGLEMARTLVSIPVVGYGETAFGLLHSQGIAFGVVGFIPELEEILRANLRTHGWEGSCVGFAYLADGPALVENALKTGDTTQLTDAMTAAAETLHRAGAQAIIPGEGLPNEALWAAGVRTLAGLPFIDADGLAVSTAHLYARTRALGLWAPGTTGYRTRRAPEHEVTRLVTVLAAAIGNDLPTAEHRAPPTEPPAPADPPRPEEPSA